MYSCIALLLCLLVVEFVLQAFVHGFFQLYVLCGSVCSVSPLVVSCALCLVVGLLGIYIAWAVFVNCVSVLFLVHCLQSFFCISQRTNIKLML